jgi:hypothetical protein
VLRPTRERTLTLVTCFPFSYLGPAPNRFVVRARQAEQGDDVSMRLHAREVPGAHPARPAASMMSQP